jgi:hypothetical protein
MVVILFLHKVDAITRQQKPERSQKMAKSKEINVKGISRDQLSEMVAHWEKFTNCYFWSSPGSASGRRSEEKRHYRNIDFVVDGVPCNYQVEVTCSCRNYYCERKVTVDGVVKAQGLRFLRKLEKYGVFSA